MKLSFPWEKNVEEKENPGKYSNSRLLDEGIQGTIRFFNSLKHLRDNAGAC